MTEPKKLTDTIFAALEDHEVIGPALNQIGESDIDELTKLVGTIRTIVARALASSSGGADNIAWLQDRLREADAKPELGVSYDPEAKKFVIEMGDARFVGESLPEAIAAMRW